MILPDFTVENHGTIFLFIPNTSRADSHLTDSVYDDAIWLGDALVVEHRYAKDLMTNLVEKGFSIE